MTEHASHEPERRGSVALKVVFTLLWLGVVAAGALVVAACLSSAGATEKQAIIGGLVVFPVLPVMWQLFARSDRRRERAAWRTWDRFSLRATVLALLLGATATLAVGPRRALEATTQFAHLPSWLAKVPGLGGKSRADRLLRLVPPEAVLVAALRLDSPLVGQMLAQTQQAAGLSLDAAVLKKCGVSSKDADLVVARGPDGALAALLSSKGLGKETALSCLATSLTGRSDVKMSLQDHGTFKIVEPSGLGSLAMQAMRFFVTDEDTVVLVQPSWQESVKARVGESSSVVTDKTLAGPYARVNPSSDVWLVARNPDLKSRTEDLAADLTLEPRGITVRATSQPRPAPGRVAPAPLTLEMKLSPGTLENVMGELGGMFGGMFKGQLFGGLIEAPAPAATPQPVEPAPAPGTPDP